MRLRISHPEMQNVEFDFELPESYTAGIEQRKVLRSEASKAHEKSASRFRMLSAKIKAWKCWAAAIERIWQEAEAEIQQYEDVDMDLSVLLGCVMQEILKRSLRREESKRGLTQYFKENPIEQQIFELSSFWIRDEIAADICDSIPEELAQYVVPPEPNTDPQIDKDAVWADVRFLPRRMAVNMIRHQHTGYDRDRFTEPYLRAFTRWNMWIADNFPLLAREAIAQIDEKMLKGGKR